MPRESTKESHKFHTIPIHVANNVIREVASKAGPFYVGKKKNERDLIETYKIQIIRANANEHTYFKKTTVNL